MFLPKTFGVHSVIGISVRDMGQMMVTKVFSQYKVKTLFSVFKDAKEMLTPARSKVEKCAHFNVRKYLFIGKVMQTQLLVFT